MKDDILPCPRCGEEAFFNPTIYADVGIIQCKKCPIRYSILGIEKDLIKAWNTRKSKGLPDKGLMKERIKIAKEIYDVTDFMDMP